MQNIPIIPSSNGAYQGPRSCDGALPSGHVFVADTLDMTDFYACNGFVTLTIEDGIVTGYMPNIEAWEAWKASLPEPETPEEKLTLEDMAEAMIDLQVEMINLKMGVN